MAKLPAPKNRLVGVVKVVLDALIEGLGVELAVNAAIAEAPFLGLPVIRNVFKWIVEEVAETVNENMFKFAAKFIIRIQADGRKAEFDEAMKPFSKEEFPTPEEIQRAKDAINRLVNRNR